MTQSKADSELEQVDSNSDAGIIYWWIGCGLSKENASILA